MTDTSWELYKDLVVVRGEAPAPLKTYYFGIDQEELIPIEPDFNPRLPWFKKSYHFHLWHCDTDRVSQGLPMSAGIFIPSGQKPSERTGQAPQRWRRNNYFLLKKSKSKYKDIYPVITREERNGENLLRIKMVVASSFDSASDYLISRYASTDQRNPPINLPGSEYGI
ncbi:MAG: hypothetical protein GY940_35545, partial [bacterium]|nr:hypothetical protein [bacterium]